MAGIGIYAYVSHSGSNEVRVLELNPENGDLATVQEVGVSGTAWPMAVTPDRRFLYVALRSRPYKLACFAIDGVTGRLGHLADAPLADSMSYISTDRSGRFLLGTAIPEDKSTPRASLVSVSAIGPHGFVQPPHQIVRTEPKMHCIQADPANRYVLATACDGDVILRMKLDLATGKFSPNPLPPVRVKPKTGPRHFIFHPNNRIIYLIGEADGSIYTFDYDAVEGAWRELAIVSALPRDFSAHEAHAADLHLTPDGRFLYATEMESSTIAAFRVDPVSGLLERMATYETENWPRTFAIDPCGRWLLAAGQKSNSITTYAIDRESGTLTKLKQYAMGKGPNWIEIVRL
jgi:6-phosphogluconolactonase